MIPVIKSGTAWFFLAGTPRARPKAGLRPLTITASGGRPCGHSTRNSPWNWGPLFSLVGIEGPLSQDFIPQLLAESEELGAARLAESEDTAPGLPRGAGVTCLASGERGPAMNSGLPSITEGHTLSRLLSPGRPDPPPSPPPKGSAGRLHGTSSDLSEAHPGACAPWRPRHCCPGLFALELKALEPGERGEEKVEARRREAARAVFCWFLFLVFCLCFLPLCVPALVVFAPVVGWLVVFSLLLALFVMSLCLCSRPLLCVPFPSLLFCFGVPSPLLCFSRALPPFAVAPAPCLASSSLCGVERSGVERSGVERSGVERSGVERSGVEWSGVE